MRRLKAALPVSVLILVLFAMPLLAGELYFEVIPSSQSLRVGDTLVLTMKVVVSGESERIDVEPLSKFEIPGFATISTSPRHRRGKEGEVEFEERITTFKLVAEQPGKYKIPSFEIPYYSQQNEYQGSLTSQELEIVVAPSRAGLAAKGLYIIGIFLLAVLATVTAFFFWFRRIKSKQFSQEENQNKREKYSRWAAELQKFLANGKRDSFTEQAFHYVNEFIEDNYQITLKGKKFEKRLQLLNEKKVPDGLNELFKITYGYSQEYKFGGILHSVEELRQLWEELKAIDKYLDDSNV